MLKIFPILLIFALFAVTWKLAAMLSEKRGKLLQENMASFSWKPQPRRRPMLRMPSSTQLGRYTTRSRRVFLISTMRRTELNLDPNTVLQEVLLRVRVASPGAQGAAARSLKPFHCDFYFTTGSWFLAYVPTMSITVVYNYHGPLATLNTSYLLESE